MMYAFGDLVLIEVGHQCGGLPPGSAEKMFTPFTQRSDHKSGPGLGLSIARESIEADGGTLSVRDLPGAGCVFTISLPRHLVSFHPANGAPRPSGRERLAAIRRAA